MNLAEYNTQHRNRERGNEDGSVRLAKTKKKQWEGVYHAYVNGKRSTRVRIIGPCSEMTKTQARDEHREWVRRFHQKPVADSAASTVGQLADDYYLLCVGDWSLAWQQTQRSLIDCIVKPGIGDRALDKVTAEDLKQFLNSLPNRTWIPKTVYRLPDGTTRTSYASKPRHGVSMSLVRKTITMLRAIFDLAAERDLIRKNPARSVSIKLTIPKATRRVDKSVFPPAQLPALLAQLGARDSLIVWIAVLGATRPGELFAIKGGDVGPQWVFVQRALDRRRNFKGTKTDNTKAIALPPKVAAELHDWMRANAVGPDDLVFQGQDGRPLDRGNFLKRHLRPAAKRAKIATTDVDFQMLRRSFATVANAVGFDIKSIQAQLGHARPDMALTEYIQSVDEVRLTKMTELENILRGVIPMPRELSAKLGTALVQ